MEIVKIIIIFTFILIVLVKLFSKLPFLLREPLTKFWEYREMRWMIAICGVIYFSQTVLPKGIEINHKGTATFNHGTTTINHDFGGNMHKPINLQFSDPGYPIKV